MKIVLLSLPGIDTDAYPRMGALTLRNIIDNHESSINHTYPIARRITAPFIAFLLISALGMPTLAMGDELIDLLSRANEIQDQIESSQTEYINAVNAQQMAESNLANTKDELSKSRDMLSAIVKGDYVGTTSFLESILGGTDISGLCNAANATSLISQKKAKATTDIANLEKQQEEEIAAAKKAQEEADAKKADFEQQYNAIQPELQELTAKFNQSFGDNSKAGQAASILNYVSNVRGTTDAQIRVVKAAYKTAFRGGGYCEAWVESVYRNAGVSMPQYGTAYDDFAANCTDTDPSKIRAGDLVYGSGTNSYANHVGVAVSDATGPNGEGVYIIDEYGSLNKAVSFQEWTKWQTVRSSRNGKTGYFGSSSKFVR